MNKVFMRFTVFAAAIVGACLLCLIFCGMKVAYAATSISLVVGQKTDAALVLGWGDEDEYKCSSSQEKVASVNKKGIVKAKLAGQTTITLKKGKSKKTLNVTVYAQASPKLKKPAALKRLKAKPSGKNDVTLSWKKSACAAGYIVYRKVGSSYLPIRIIKGASSLSCKVKGLQANKLQRFRVGAYSLRKEKCKRLTKNAKGKWVAKESKGICWKLGNKSPWASALTKASTVEKANVGSIEFGRKKLTIVGKRKGKALASVISKVDGKKVASDKIRYKISNSSVAKVNSKGVVKSKVKKKVTCKVIAYAHNGVRAKLKVRIVKALKRSDSLFIAHRGDISAAPENTVASLKKAGKNGYKAVEFDVWETKDGSLVVCHYDNLLSTCGIDLNVRKLSTDSASEYYIKNYRIINGNNISKLGNVTIPSFEKMVKTAAKYNFSLTVHVKNRVSHPLSSEGLAEIKRILKEYGMAKKTKLASHSTEMLKTFDTSGLACKQFVVLSNSGYDIESSKYKKELLAAADAAKASGCTSLSLCWRSSYPLDRSLITYCHKIGLDVDVWTVASMKTVCRLIDIGADAIICDKKLFG